MPPGACSRRVSILRLRSTNSGRTAFEVTDKLRRMVEAVDAALRQIYRQLGRL